MIEFFTNLSPVLPDARLLRWLAPMCWGVVLAFLWLRVGGRFGKRTRLWVGGVVVAWALIPSMWSPAYWLGLAFQVPSWMTVLLCGAYLLHSLGRASTQALPPVDNQASLYSSAQAACLVFLGIALGWVLLLDTLVLLPVYVYRWGFGAALLACVVVIALVLCVAQPARDQRAYAVVYPGYVLAVALLLFVLTRLPTGNVLDALIDPWLWLWLQVSLVRRVIRRGRHRQNATATRG